jgi:diguanylate cyclase (GGDEF)-like protein
VSTQAHPVVPFPRSLASHGGVPHGNDALLREQIFRAFRIRLTPAEEDHHWRSLMRHHEWSAARLGPGLDLRTSAFDYFLNRARLLEQPVVLESEAMRESERAACSDPLTGLRNKAYFEAEVELEACRSRRHRRPLCLVLLELDRPLSLAGRCGAERDLVSQEMGALLKRGLRSGDVAARFSGNEFGILLHQAELEAGVRIALSLKEAAEQHFSESSLPGEGPAIVGMGLAAMPGDAASAAELMMASDRALYHSKRTGPNLVAFRWNGRLVSLSDSKGAADFFRRLGGCRP